jgi:hypothetical protein
VKQFFDFTFRLPVVKRREKFTFVKENTIVLQHRGTLNVGINFERRIR